MNCEWMELQLGLALPTNPPHHDHHHHHLDLNTCCSDYSTTTTTTLFNQLHKKRSLSQVYYLVDDDDKKKKKKENNSMIGTSTSSSTLLPLLPLTPNNHDHIITPPSSSSSSSNCSSTTILLTKSDENDVADDVEEGPAVGWPPLNCWRKKRLSLGGYDEDIIIGGRRSSSNNNNNDIKRIVKVKMEGVGIARKVDLSLHHSFHSLNQTLFHMFGICHRRFSKCYQLAYQDHEGDWLLAQDVPWRSFIQCAQRLKLLKISTAADT